MFLILITMIFHIINAVRMKDVEGIWFDQNAVAGLVFYGSLVAVIFLFMTGHTLPAGAVLGVMFGIPLVIIMLKEPLARMVKKESPVIEGSKGMYFVQSFFELFEVMLSYLSNTLSFVRIGQPCRYDGSRTDACRCRSRKPELDRCDPWKYFRYRDGGSYCRYPGTPSRIL